MGCWNTTCGISGLPIHAGEEVVVFLLTQNQYSFMEEFVYNDTYFKPCLLPFYGNYNDYGDVEDCYGKGIPVLLEALKAKLVEMEVGENEYHDIEAKKELLTMEYMFELDHEDRLFIKGNGRYLDKLKVVHVQIKKSIFDYILDNYKLHTYDSKTYKRINHSFKEAEEELISVPSSEFSDGLRSYRYLDRDKYPLVSSILWERLGSPLYSLDDVQDNKDILQEMLKGGLINVFMEHIRKPWIKQIGNGSQTTDPEPYLLLMKGMKKVLKQEKEERDAY